MARRRMIDGAFWQSETMAKLTMPQRLLFIGVFSNADDQGRLKAHPRLIRSMLFPYDEISGEQIAADLQVLAELDCVILYEVDGKQLLQLPNWWKYQHHKWAWPSELAPPDGWIDRLRYRKGNSVVVLNWDDGNAEATTEPSQGDAIVEPEWNDNGDGSKPAPNGSNSVSTSVSDNDRIQETPPAAPAYATPTNLDAWIALLKDPPEGTNRTAVLRAMGETLWPDTEAPPFSRFGQVAKQVGGAERLAQLMWQANAGRVTGDYLSYCLQMSKRNKDASGQSKQDRSMQNISEWGTE